MKIKLVLQHLKALERAPHVTAFSGLELNIPPLPEQRRIAEILSAADRKLELERRRKEKLERVKVDV